MDSEHSFGNKLARVAWGLVWLIFFRCSLRCTFGWRRMLLRLFGAQIGDGVKVYPSTKVWAPWNLVMDDGSCMGDYVDCYCVGKIRICSNAVVSQYSYLCGATHDYEDEMKLVTGDIEIGADAWVCADVFIGPGVNVGERAVAGARSVVIRDVESGTVVAGNPAKEISKREKFRQDKQDGDETANVMHPELDTEHANRR
ncbi:hypothetical protein BVX97_04245 [bacterium E08(2017)]|nr:hypothetical protein BVX97_04245 [bacterium E08(2017)]